MLPFFVLDTPCRSALNLMQDGSEEFLYLYFAISNVNNENVGRRRAFVWWIACDAPNVRYEAGWTILCMIFCNLKMQSRTRKLHLLFLIIFCFGQGKQTILSFHNFYLFIFFLNKEFFKLKIVKDWRREDSNINAMQ